MQLFTTELPILRSKEDLQCMQATYSDLDPYYIASGCIEERKTKFEKLWERYSQYADSNYLSELKKHFHQRTWEMYLGNVLLEKNMELCSKKTNKGPDFIIKNVGYIECVAATKGDPSTQNVVPEIKISKSVNNIEFSDVPVDKIIMRITSSIRYKAESQYCNWKNEEWFNKDTPYFIAINTGDLDFIDDPKMPYVIKSLFGIHDMTMDLENKTTSWSFRCEVEKASGTKVPVNYFLNNTINNVSGIIFSNNRVVDHPSDIGMDCTFVNNPFAKNIADCSFCQLFGRWIARKNNNSVKLTNMCNKI